MSKANAREYAKRKGITLKDDDEKKTGASSKPQSSSVENRAKNSTFMGGGSSVKKTEERAKGPSQEKLNQVKNRTGNTSTSRTTRRTQTTTGPQRQTDTGTGSQSSRRTRDAQMQKMYGTTRPQLTPKAEADQRRTERRTIAQAQKSGDYDKASELRGSAKPGSIREKYEQWDRDIADTVSHTIKQGLADDARVVNVGLKGMTDKDAWLYTTQEQRDKADRKFEERDSRLGKKIEAETKAMQDIQDKHGYLGKKVLEGISTLTGMGMDLAANAIVPGTGLGHMWMRSTGASLGQVEKKAEALRAQLKKTGQYSDDELDEMFKDVKGRDMAYATAMGGIEYLSEKIFRGFGPVSEYLGKGGSFAEKIGGKLLSRAASKLPSGFWGNFAKGYLEEGSEEEIGGRLQAWAGNLIYGNKFQEYQEDSIKRSLMDESNALRSQAHSEEEARAAAARLGSTAFMNDSAKMYQESGYSKEESERLAELTRDYLTASLSGDVDAMKQYQDEMVDLMSGGENSQKEKWTLQDSIDSWLVTGLVTLTGVPGGVSTMMMGNSYKENLGMDVIKEQAEQIKNWGDKKESSQAQAVIDHIDNGGDLSGTQVYEIIQKSAELAEKSKEPEQIKNRMAQVEMNKRDLRISPVNPDGTLAPQTEQRYEQIFSSTVARYGTLAQLGENTGFEIEDVEIGADAGAAFNVGVISAEQVNEVAKGNATVKTVFQDVTGIDINQFDSYTEMNEALMAKAADNMLNSARLEQAAWNDEARGAMAQSMSNEIGVNGNEAVLKAFMSIDPRDRGKFLLTGEAASRVYEYAKRTEDSWDQVKHEFKDIFKGTDQTALKAVFDAAKEDKVIEENEYWGKAVKAGEKLSQHSSEQVQVPGDVTIPDNIPMGAEDRLFLQTWAKAMHVNYDVVDTLPVMVRNAAGEIVEGQAEGSFKPTTNTLTVNVNEAITKPIQKTIKHELSHSAIYAPDEMLDLLKYIRDAWYREDPEGYINAINDVQARYSGEQNLSELEALEELMADGSADFEFWNDPHMAERIANENPSLAQKILNVIRDVLRKIRSVLASGNIINREYSDAVFAYAVDMSRAEELYINAISAANKAKADMAIDEWQERSHGLIKSEPVSEGFGDELTSYSIRNEAPPKKTIKAYKVFVAFKSKPGELYPPMVASPGGMPTPVGRWVNADTGELARNKDGSLVTTKKGRVKVQEGGKGTNKGKGGSLAWRPGWHLGSYPDAKQFAVKDPETGEARTVFPPNFVWAECEIAADNDYQLEALSYGVTEKGKFDRTQAGLPYIPKDGYYKYRTNADPKTVPWLITGAMKVNRILDDEEAREICAQFGATPMKRAGGDIDLAEYGFEKGEVTPTSKEDLAKLPPAVDYSDEIRDLPGYVQREINFDDPQIRKELAMNGQDADYYKNLYEERKEELISGTADTRYSIRTSNEILAARDDTAIFIKNTPKANYIDMIFNEDPKKRKTEETRATRTLDAFIGKEVAVTDGKKVYGTVVLGEPHKYSAEDFRSDKAKAKHHVPDKDDEYSAAEGKGKWAYPIESYSKYDEPKALSDSKDYVRSYQAREMKFSRLVNLDDDYMQAVNSGNMDEAQRLVDEAAKTAGYGYHGYHGTTMPLLRYDALGEGEETDYENKRFPFTEFDTNKSVIGAIYISSQRGYADAISRTIVRDENGNVDFKKNAVFDLYVRMDNPLVVNEHIYDSVPRFYAIPTPSVMKNDGYTQETLSTEEIAMYAQKNGYDGVVIEGLREGGDFYTDDYIVFSGSQVKSADPVTYAEDGSIIPLSERFDPNNNDIRYSRPTIDAEGNILTDGQMEYFKNSQARDLDGKLLVLYHHSNAVFDSFNPDLLGTSSGDRYPNTAYGFFVTDDLEFSKQFGENEYKLYANIQNPIIHPYGAGQKYSDEECENITRRWLETIDPEQFDYYEELREEDPGLTLYDYYMDLFTPGESPYEYADYEREVLEEAGFDAVEIIEGVKDGADKPTTSYALFNREQPKFVDNLDPTDAPEMRFSIASDNDAMTYAAAMANSTDDLWANDPVIAEGRVRYSMSKKDFVNAASEKWTPSWTESAGEFNATTAEKNIRKVIMAAMESSDTNARYRQSTVRRTLKVAKEAYNDLKKGDHKQAAETIYDHSLSIIENLEFFAEDQKEFQRWKDLRDYLKKTRMTVAKEDREADYSEFRQRNFSKILLVNEGGIDPTEAWDELNKIWPDVYTEDIKEDPNAILKQTEYALDILKPMSQAYTSEECVSLASSIANDIFDIVYQGKDWNMVSDGYAEKTAAMKERHAEATRVMQRSIQNERLQYTGKIKSIKSKGKVKDTKRKERQVHRQLYNRVLNEYNDLTSKLLNPSKDRTKNIPEQLRQPLAEMLAAFDLEKERSKKLEETYRIPTRTQINFRQLKDAMEKVAKEEGAETEFDAYLNYIGEKIETIADKMDLLGDHSIDALDNEDIETIKDMLTGLNESIKNWHQLEIDGEKYQAQVKCDEVGEGAKEYSATFGESKQYGRLRGFLDNVVNMGELTPIYFFRQIKGVYDMYRQLRKGFDDYVRNEKVVIDKIADILAPYYKKNRKGELKPGSEIEEWRYAESAETINLTYGPITLTIAQKMSLYCLSKREATKSHMYSDNGGIVASEITAGSMMHKFAEAYKGKNIEYKQLQLTPADVETIIASLTEEQKQIADQLQDLMSNDMSEIGNATSMKLIGIRMYKEKDYFPIKVQGESLPKNLDNISMREKVRNPGFSNPLKDNPTNPIIIDDIFSVVAKHCNEMNMYASYAVPLTNFMKVYNGSVMGEDGKAVKIQTLLKQTYGEKAVQYIDNFLDDINGNSFKRKGGLDDVLDKALGQAKKAAVFANLRVALQQPTAIVRALAVMDLKYFTAKPLERDADTKLVEEMWEHCPIALWKSWGYYDTHFGRDIEDVMMGRNVESKLSFIMSDVYGRLDNWTWSLIWQAVKNEVKDKNPDVKVGSPEFWDLCAERASYVFDTTQVVDSPFHRSNDMRSKNGLVKQLTSFQSEPTLSFNVLRQGILDGIEAAKKGNKAAATKAYIRVAAVWIGQALLVSLAQSIVDGLRRKGHKDSDDDEDATLAWYEEIMKYFKKNYGKNLVDDINPLNNIYWVKDFLPGILNAITGEYVYGQSNLAYQWADTLTNGIQMCKKKWEKGDSYSKTWYDCLSELFGGLGYAAGLPIKTGARGVKNAFHWFNKITGAMAFADDGSVDKYVDSFVDRFRSDDTSSSSSDNKKSKKESAEFDSQLKDYEEGLSDTYSEDQKKKLVKQYKKKLESETSAEYDADMDVQEHVRQGLIDFEYEMEKRSLKAAEKAAGKTGNARNDALWDVIADGYTNSVESGNMATIQAMRDAFVENGGDADWFDAKITDKMKSKYKTTVGDTSPGASLRQETMRNYMTEHGVSEAEISEIVRKTATARDLKAAMRLGVEEYMIDELIPLIRAGLTREDYEYLYKYRNMGAKQYDGKYTAPKYMASTGNFIWPTEGVITSHFGYRNAPTAGASSNHPAIDIGAPQGTAVVAADGGIVIYAGTNGGYGNSVGIKHDNGMVTYYNHLSAWAVNVGDRVMQGQPIANVGSTGISTGPHLDFKILDEDGNPVDPEKYLH